MQDSYFGHNPAFGKGGDLMPRLPPLIVPPRKQTPSGLTPFEAASGDGASGRTLDGATPVLTPDSRATLPMLSHDDRDAVIEHWPVGVHNGGGAGFGSEFEQRTGGGSSMATAGGVCTVFAAPGANGAQPAGGDGLDLAPGPDGRPMLWRQQQQVPVETSPQPRRGRWNMQARAALLHEQVLLPRASGQLPVRGG